MRGGMQLVEEMGPHQEMAHNGKQLAPGSARARMQSSPYMYEVLLLWHFLPPKLSVSYAF